MSARSFLFWSLAVVAALAVAAMRVPDGQGVATLEHGLGPEVVTEPL